MRSRSHMHQPRRSAAASHAALAILVAGALACSDDSELSAEPPGPQPVEQPSCDVGDAQPTIGAIAADDSHSCVAMQPCGAICWGSNYYGEMGWPPGEPNSVGAPTWVYRDYALSQVSVGNRHTCGVSTNGDVLCWGSNDHGQLGGSAGSNRSGPVRVEDLPRAAAQVEVHGFGSCARLVDGSVYCWGGWGVAVDVPFGVSRIEGVENAVELANGATHNCVIRNDGEVLCWGGNGQGQLGDGTAGGYDTSRTDARPVEGLPARAIALGLTHMISCAVLETGEVYCWGHNYRGQLGNGSAEEMNWPTPVKVVDVEDAVDIAVAEHSCAMLEDATIKCWGEDWFMPEPRTRVGYTATPVAVDTISDVAHIGVAQMPTFVVTTDQQLYAWGPGTLGDFDVPTLIDWRSALE